MNHSPGPWKVHNGIRIDDSRGRWVASCARAHNWISERERLANARLIAQAPALLDVALRLFAELNAHGINEANCASGNDMGGGPTLDLLRHAREVIMKAGGQ